MKTQEWIDSQMQAHKQADPQVLGFIAAIRKAEPTRKLFKEGYCYYFAQMLQTAFHRGNLYYAHPLDHIIWLDATRALAYDIDGVNQDWEYLIPVKLLGDYVIDFLHIPGRQSEDPAGFDRYIQELLEHQGWISQPTGTGETEAT